jgi:hypothetical protein
VFIKPLLKGSPNLEIPQIL